MAMKVLRFRSSVVVAVMGFAIASSAGAVEISIIGDASATIVQGGSFTINLGMDNASLDSTPGFEGTISGLAAAGADVTSGMAALSYFNEFCFAGSACFNGIQFSSRGFIRPADLGASLAHHRR